MKSFSIIPAIDLIEGKAVRLSQGDFERKKIYNTDPLDQAMQFFDAGIRRLHLVDLDGAKSGSIKNLKVLEKIASRLNMDIDFGGGISRREDLLDVFNAGAKMAAIGSLAVKMPELFDSWLGEFGGSAIFLGADVRDGLIAIKGWTETTEIKIEDFLEDRISKGIHHVFCTDINRDGMLEGPSLDFYSALLKRFPDLQLTASGGVSKMDDLHSLREVGCAGVIVGKAIYEGRIRLSDLKGFVYI